MTAAAIADLLGARRMGRGRWTTNCPAHPDHSPSLSISEGRDGRTLIRCWGGCDTAAVLAALGLRWRDVCGDLTLTPLQARQALLQRGRDELQARERRARHGAICDKLLKLEAIAGQLGATLMRLPDDSPDLDQLTRFYHSVQARIRAAERAEMGARP